MNWQYLKENERKETVDNLRKLYECVYYPFKFDEILGEAKRYRHNMMIEKMSELKLTDELSYTLTLFKKQTGQMIVPRLPEVDKVEANEELLNKASKYNVGMWSYKEKKLEMKVREEENKEIVKGFDQVDRNFKVITDKQDGLALLMTTEITTTRDDVWKLRDELEKNKQIFEREQRAWEELEWKLGKVIKDYKEFKTLLMRIGYSNRRNIETFEEEQERDKRDNDHQEEKRYLGSLETIIGVKENAKRRRQEDEEYERKWEASTRRLAEEWEWWDGYFDADFGKIGYAWLPAYCVARPVGIIQEEYNRHMKGEKIMKGRLFVALSAVMTYFSLSVMMIIKLSRYVLEELVDLIRKEIEEYDASKENGRGSGNMMRT